MPLSDVEEAICKAVVSLFITQNKPTTRRSLLKQFKGVVPEALNRLVNLTVLKGVSNTSDAFLPTSLAFRWCGDTDMLRFGKHSVEGVLRTLHFLFDRDLELPEQPEYTPAEIEAEAKKLKALIEPETIRVGLYLAGECGVFASTRSDPEYTEIAGLRIGERILTIGDIANAWDNHIQQWGERLERESAPDIENPAAALQSEGLSSPIEQAQSPPEGPPLAQLLAARLKIEARTGSYEGMATLLSNSLAVTTYHSILKSGVMKDPSHRITLWSATAPSAPVNATIQASDAVSDFAVLRLTVSVPSVVPPDLLGTTLLILDSEWQFYCVPPSDKERTFVVGRLDGTAEIDGRQYLQLIPSEWLPESDLRGAPVVVRERLAGIIAEGNNTGRLLFAVPISAMAKSKETDAIRKLLPGVQSPPTNSTTATPSAVSQGPRSMVEAAVRALSDKPSTVDLLDFADYAQALIDLIQNPKTQTPLTIGIDGAWGSGKTTLMGMMKTQLDQQRSEKGNKAKPHTIWFNAWKYDREESLWAALALEILSQVRKRLSMYERAELWIKLNLKRLDIQKLLKDVAKSILYPAIGVVVTIACIVSWRRWVEPSIELSKWLAITLAGC